MDALMLSRIQFGANITFHILFPAITIALCWVLLFFKLRYDTTRDEKWLDAYRFWVKPFALCFALGVVSGVTMSFQFGTNDYYGLPFIGAMAVFTLGFLGLAYSFYPFVILDKMTIWQAASAPESLAFILVGALIVLPFILGYTFYSYRVFWGKVRELTYY